MGSAGLLVSWRCHTLRRSREELSLFMIPSIVEPVGEDGFDAMNLG